MYIREVGINTKFANSTKVYGKYKSDESSGLARHILHNKLFKLYVVFLFVNEQVSSIIYQYTIYNTSMNLLIQYSDQALSLFFNFNFNSYELLNYHKF